MRESITVADFFLDSIFQRSSGSKGRKRSRPQSSIKSDDVGRGGSRSLARRKKTEASSRKERIRRYYHLGTWCGPATAVTLYHLSRQMDKDDNDSLWLAIVGFTDQFIHSRIDQVSSIAPADSKIIVTFSERIFFIKLSSFWFND